MVVAHVLHSAAGGSDAAFAELWVNDRSDGTSQVIHRNDLTGTSHTSGTTLTEGHQYRWWVRAHVGGIWRAWSGEEDFTVTSE